MRNRTGQAAALPPRKSQARGEEPAGLDGPRRLGPQEAGLVAELEKACFSTPWSVEQLRKGLEQGGIKIVGIIETGRLLGYLSYYSVGEEAEIINFAVDPGRRRQGLGRAMLRHVLHKWREEGIESGFLEVRASNGAAIGLYESFGFRQIGVRKRYYPETGEDALLLKLSLAEPPGLDKRLKRRIP